MKVLKSLSAFKKLFKDKLILRLHTSGELIFDYEASRIFRQFGSIDNYYQTVTDFKAEDFTFPPCISDILVKYDSWENVNISNRNRTMGDFAEEWASFKGKKEYTEYTIVFRKK